MNDIMKFRYISFIGMINPEIMFMRQRKYLNKLSKFYTPLKKSMYQDIWDFLKKYRKRLDTSRNITILYNKEKKMS